MKPLISYWGGKQRIASKIVPLKIFPIASGSPGSNPVNHPHLNEVGAWGDHP